MPCSGEGPRAIHNAAHQASRCSSAPSPGKSPREWLENVALLEKGQRALPHVARSSCSGEGPRAIHNAAHQAPRCSSAPSPGKSPREWLENVALLEEGQRALPHVARSSVEEYVPDLVIYFPSCDYGGNWRESEQRFTKDDLELIFTQMFAGWHQAEFQYKECEKLLRGAANHPTARRLVRKAVITDLIEFLEHEDSEIEVFKSCDGDELFLCVALGDPGKPAQKDAVALKAAQDLQLRVQTDLGGFDPNGQVAQKFLSIRAKAPDRLKAMREERELGSPCVLHATLDIVQSTSPNEEAFVHFHQNVVDKVIELCKLPNLDSPENKPTFLKRYDAGIAGADGSVLRTIDRVRLLVSKISDFVDLDDVVSNKLAKGYYVPHKYSKLLEFRNGKPDGTRYYDKPHIRWSSFRYQTVLSIVYLGSQDAQPLQEIRDYFGESVAFYFLWLGYTTRCICVTVPVSIVLSLMYSVVTFNHEPTPTELQIQAFCHFVAIFGFSIGAMIYLKFWRRNESYYMALWDTDAIDIRNSHRSDFHGIPAPDPLDEWGKTTKYFPPTEATILLIVTFIITILFFIVIIITVTLIYYVQTLLPLSRKVSAFVVSLAFSFQIIVYQLTWNSISTRLVDFANPRTDSDAKDLTVQLLFPISFVSAYSNIAFHGFFSSWGIACVGENCMITMRPSMYQVVIPAMGMQVFSMVLPFLKYRYDLYDEMQKLKQSRRLRENEQIARCFLEEQAKRPRFTSATLNSETNTMVIMTGYVILFGFCAPGIVVAVMCAFMLKIRIDAFKMCSVYQRRMPLQKSAHGLGKWDAVLRELIVIGRYVSCTVCVFNLNYFNLPAKDALLVSLMNGGDVNVDVGLTFFQKCIVIFATVEVLDRLCSMIDHSIKDVSEDTKLMITKRATVNAQITFKLASAEPRATPVQRRDSSIGALEVAKALIQADKLEAVPALDSTHHLWSHVTKEDCSPLFKINTYFGD